MCPVYRRSESDLEIMEKGFAAMSCSELLSNCPGFLDGRHSFGENDTIYWEGEKYIKQCPCLRQCGSSTSPANWATRYWKKLSLAYLELCDAVQSSSTNNTDTIVADFVIAINNILRGIWKHFAAMQTEKPEKGTTGCIHVDDFFFPDQKPVYFLSCRFARDRTL